jgi:adenylate cyclase
MIAGGFDNTLKLQIQPISSLPNYFTTKLEGKNENFSADTSRTAERLGIAEQLVDLQTLYTQRKDRLTHTLKARYQHNPSINRSQDYLRKHVRSKISLIIVYADLVDSTKLSNTLVPERLVTVIRTFSHELSLVIESYNGYVLKYVGDSVIAFFPYDLNRYHTGNGAVECGKSMINVLTNGINPILRRLDYQELSIKVGIDAGESVIVLYGSECDCSVCRRRPTDILGYAMNVTSKITSLTDSNKVSVGENVYKLLDKKVQSEFHEVIFPGPKWKFVNLETGNQYKVYTSN